MGGAGDRLVAGISAETDRSAASASPFGSYRVAVLVPCYNEAVTVAQVVRDFAAALPQATVFVYDNNSTDDTVSVARAAGAEVFRETRQGKGFVVRRMFTDIEADVYVLVDGDATYDAPSAPRMIARLIGDRCDMVVGTRVDKAAHAYRAGHRTGNRLLTGFVANVFGHSFTDMLSGYRVFSRRFVKSFPLLSSGFEIETELTVHALELGLAVSEIETPYYARPEGSFSKLNTYPVDHHPALPLGAANALLRRSRRRFRHRVAWLRGADLHHLCRNGPGAAAADGGPVDRPDARRLPVVCRRAHPRHGEPRPA